MEQEEQLELYGAIYKTVRLALKAVRVASPSLHLSSSKGLPVMWTPALSFQLYCLYL